MGVKVTGSRKGSGKIGGIRHGGDRLYLACMCFVIFSLVFRPVVSRRRLLFGFVIILCLLIEQVEC